MVPGTAVITLTDDESIYSAGSSFVFSSAFGPHHGRELGIDVLSDWNALWLLDYNRSLLLQGGLGLPDETLHQLDPADYYLPEAWRDLPGI